MLITGSFSIIWQSNSPLPLLFSSRVLFSLHVRNLSGPVSELANLESGVGKLAYLPLWSRRCQNTFSEKKQTVGVNAGRQSNHNNLNEKYSKYQRLSAGASVTY